MKALMVMYDSLRRDLLSVYGGPIPAPVSYTHLDVYKRQGLRELAERTISKVNALTDAEYKELSVYPADEV